MHDLVEVYAGDTYFYSTDEAHVAGKHEREEDARQRIEKEFPEFADLHIVISEYEKRKDPESRFVYALDKIQPVVNIYLDNGRLWKERHVTLAMLIEKKKDKVLLSPEIEEYFNELVVILKEKEAELFLDAKKKE